MICMVGGNQRFLPAETNAHLFEFDSVHGRFWAAPLPWVKTTMDAGPRPDPRDRERTLQRCLGATWNIVLECTGISPPAIPAAKHLANGSKRVVISARVKTP